MALPSRVHRSAAALLLNLEATQSCRFGGESALEEIGADAEFFHFFQGVVLSVREKPQGSTIDISVVDLGMSPAQIEWLEDQKVVVANPDWEYDLSVV